MHTTFRLKPEAKESFALWQAKLHAALSKTPGFVSLQILALGKSHHEWKITLSFTNQADWLLWKESERKKALFEALSLLVIGPIKEFEDKEACVTEVFVTEVEQDREDEYKLWLAKIHEVEARFDGFQGACYQLPRAQGSKNWLTLLHFDTKEHLTNWLQSKERKKLLEEAAPFIKSFYSHHIPSSFSGWFSSSVNTIPPVWKQTALVLLVLYPIVMLEILFLNPLLTHLELPVSIFIGNVISVSLISWPLLPIAIRFLNWWLETDKLSLNIKGIAVILFLYFIEIFLFS